MPHFFTRQGDDGSTGLLGRGLVPKHDLQPWVFGTVDEASAALGLAKSFLGSDDTRQVLTHAQRDLYHLMAEVAVTREEAKRFRTIDTSHIEWLEIRIEKYGGDLEAPTGFVCGGDIT